MTLPEPRHLLVRAGRDAFPLYEPREDGIPEDTEAFTWIVPLDDPRLGLSQELAGKLSVWSASRPPNGFASRPDLRKHVKQGLAAARRLARDLGPSWAVRYWDEQHRTAKWVCWGCDRLSWERDSHGTPPHPVHITVEGEYLYGPLRADGFGDFAPEDPVAALYLSHNLVSGLAAWAQSINTTLNRQLQDRQDGKYDGEWQRLFHEGMGLAQRLARELGPARTVTYIGLVNGGLSTRTTMTWQGDKRIEGD
jgi:hypothetical protein